MIYDISGTSRTLVVDPDYEYTLINYDGTQTIGISDEGSTPSVTAAEGTTIVLSINMILYHVVFKSNSIVVKASGACKMLLQKGRLAHA